MRSLIIIALDTGCVPSPQSQAKQSTGTLANAVRTRSCSGKLLCALPINTSTAQESFGLAKGGGAGVTAYDPARHSSLEALVAEADAAMFAEKRGRLGNANSP